VLLTGINLPDHGAMFSLLKKMLIKDISPHVATLNYASCPNLKTLVKQTVAQLIRKVSDWSIVVTIHKLVDSEYWKRSKIRLYRGRFLKDPVLTDLVWKLNSFFNCF
jgi:hypothetical protein